ncbi:MAG: FtsX-like permease family protein [Proteobacteria bacterium]|nr:FtsX-like permease family protein [Pseudomonadota bacterium]
MTAGLGEPAPRQPGGDTGAGSSWPLALRLARRELRGGFRGFKVMLACLTLGVGAIAAIGSFSAAIKEGIARDARTLLGGDVDLRLMHRTATDAQLHYLTTNGTVSAIARMRAMAYADRTVGEKASRPALVEIKAVDGAYPLFGEVILAPAMALKTALAPTMRAFGAVAERDLLIRLGLTLGDRVRLGAAEFVIRAVLMREPDRGSGVFKLGPRMIISQQGLGATGLVQPGSLIHHHYKVGLAPGMDVDRWTAKLTAAFPDAGWRFRTVKNPVPRIARFVERFGLFLTLIGLGALLIGGIGVGNAVKSYLDGKTSTIATLKCLGAPAKLIFRTYLIQVMVMAAAGIALGLIIGAALPALAVSAFKAYLPVDPRFGLHGEPLALGAAYGVLTALGFTLWPLARARQISAAGLFRDLVSPDRRRPPPAYIAATLSAVLALAFLAYATAASREIALWFIGATILALAAFSAEAHGLRRCAQWLAKKGAIRRRFLHLHLAIANLGRPGAPTAIIVTSLGIGLTLFVTLAEIEGNLERQIRRSIPERAPSYYFIDIQPAQAQAFDAVIASVPGAGELRRMPSLRARIVRINGIGVDRAAIAPTARWVVRGDRGLTYTATPPPYSRVVAGEWWPADYSGPPVISLDAHIARGFGVGVGDTLTFNLLGREITATIANLRRVDWISLALNFVVIFAPGTLEGAPQTHIATVKAAPGSEEAVRSAVTSRFANITAIHVRDALEAAAAILAAIATAGRATGAVALMVGTLVLAGAIAAGQRRRIYDAVVLKIVGARRSDILRAFVIEFAIVGLASSALAGLFGCAAAYLILTRVMDTSWAFLPGPVIGAALGCTGVTMAFGFAGTWRALGQTAASALRTA